MMTTETGALKLTTRGDREIVMTRTFDAPRALVFDAHTRPELVKRWLLGPPGWTMPTCQIDLKVGGAFRFVWRNQKGEEMGMGGLYREIARPQRLVNTEKFDVAWYPGEGLSTLVLEEKDGKTVLTNTIRYESQDARDGVLKSGMERGVAASYDRLADIVKKMDPRVDSEGTRSSLQ